MAKVKNVLVLMCDHHRFDALGCLGNPLAHTPNLDRLASQSVHFENCYTQAPVCAPARHSLATGRYVHAHGVYTNSHFPYPGIFTIAHMLKPFGYRRFQLGHMHWTDPSIDNGYEPAYTKEMFMQTLSSAVRARYEWESQSITRRTTAGPSPRTKEEYWGYGVAKQSVQWIEEAIEKGQSFLNWTAFTEPHPPFYPPRDYYRLIDQSEITIPVQAPSDAAPPHQDIIRKQKEWKHLTEVEIRQIIAGYYGMVALVDNYCGMVLNILDRLGIRDETAIIWTVDHGEQLWEHGLFTKFVMREASVHVPLLISVPGVKPGVRSEFVEHVDIFPTICDLLDIEIPNSVQGRSLLPLLDSESPPDDWRDAVFSQIGTTQMIRTAEWKLNVYNGVPGELFDMRNDRQEFYNLAADPAHTDVINHLHHRLRKWEISFGPCQGLENWRNP